jgi:hypothetical protein
MTFRREKEEIYIYIYREEKSLAVKWEIYSFETGTWRKEKRLFYNF